MDPWKFEDNLQAVALAGLTARGIPHGTTRANAASTQERVDVVASGFSQASSQMTRTVAGVWFPAHYSGTLAFGVITQVGGNNAANHNIWVSNVRHMMSRPVQLFSAANVPCYEVVRIAERPSDLEQEKKTDAHHTEITYQVDLAILAGQVA